MFQRLIAATLSGKKAAYMALLYALIGPITRGIDKVFGPSGKAHQSDSKKLKGLVIIGLSRSGSTVINQVLVRTLPSVYFSNLHALFPEMAGPYMLRNNLFGNANMRSGNYYGYTTSVFDVNEANLLFDKIFQSGEKENQIQTFLNYSVRSGMSQERPIFIKNVKHSENIIALAEDLPGLHFIKVNREIEPLAQSVLNAYHELRYFNPIPHTLEKKSQDDPIEFAARQVIEMEKQIDFALQQIPDERLTRWSYEDFCADPKRHIMQAANLLGIPNRAELLDSLDIEIKASIDQKVTDNEAEKLREYISLHSES
jgi:hypothetical protein